MQKTSLGEIWCLTHDLHGDGRIWAFMQAFEEIGFDVLAFNPFIEFRPLPRNVRADFPKGTNGKIRQEPVEDRARLDQLAHLRTQFELSEQNGTAALSHEGWVYYPASSFGSEDPDVWGFRNLDDHWVYIKQAGCVTAFRLPGYPLLDKAIIGCLAAREAGLPASVDDTLPYLNQAMPEVSILAFEGQWIRIRGNDTAGHLSMHMLNVETLDYVISTSPYVPPHQLHAFFGLKVDYRHFRKYVYNYSAQLDHVESYIEAQQASDAGFQPPRYIYVADVTTLPVALMVKHRFGCKVIVDCHEWWAQQHLIWNPQEGVLSDRINDFERDVYQQCDARITVGNNLAKRMGEEFNCPFVGMRTVCAAPRSAQTNDLRQTLGLADDISLVLFQGSLTSNRNIESLMRATAHLEDDQHLVVMGDGFFAEQLKDVLKQHGAPEKCTFLGNVENSLMQKYTQQCSLGVVPYVALNEYFALSMPNKFSEYYASHLPMIVDRSMTEMADLAHQQGIGVVAECSDPNDLGSTIARVLRDKALQENFRKNYETKTNPFSQEALTVSVAELMKELDEK